ncbi:MAG: ribonuclease P protein component [Patescibacteria group bacterium]|nr:ribonuclease P protein component [Patescibacteria group bacterium]
MLKATQRLSRARDFKKINSAGRSCYSPFLKLKFVANNLPVARCAVVVSTRVSKKATVRNRVKRRLAEIIRLNFAEIKPGADLVFYASGRAIDAEFGELENQVGGLLAKARLLK